MLCNTVLEWYLLCSSVLMTINITDGMHDRLHVLGVNVRAQQLDRSIASHNVTADRQYILSYHYTSLENASLTLAPEHPLSTLVWGFRSTISGCFKRGCCKARADQICFYIWHVYVANLYSFSKGDPDHCFPPLLHLLYTRILAHDASSPCYYNVRAPDHEQRAGRGWA